MRTKGYLALIVIAVTVPACQTPRKAPTVHAGATQQIPTVEEVEAARSKTARLANLRYGPVVTFERSCARCHGREGASYHETFYRLDRRRLVQAVIDMMHGQTHLKPTDADILAMTAYQQAIQEKVPFVVIDNAASVAGNRRIHVQGEVSPGSTVEVRKTSQVLAADVKGAKWTMANPPEPPFEVIARRDGRQAAFEFPARQWSGVSTENP